MLKNTMIRHPSDDPCNKVLTEQQLLERGWRPERLDTAQLASNADLLAIKGGVASPYR